MAELSSPHLHTSRAAEMGLLLCTREQQCPRHQLLKMDALCRGQLSTQEVGGGQGSAFSKRSSPDSALSGVYAKEGWAPSASHPLGG